MLRLFLMPLYGELLAAALQHAGPQPKRRGPLLAALLDRRQRLDSAVPGVERLAIELDYDVALIRFCRATGIDADLAAFDRPAHARHDLEQSLVEEGFFVLEVQACLDDG